MLRVWVGERPAGLLDRHKNRGSAFTYADPSDDVDAISLTMPKRLASWTVDYGLAPIFDMNLPEGALRALLTAKFARAAGSFDDLDLLTVVGRAQIGRLRYSGANEDLAAEVPFQSVDEILKARRGGGLFEHLMQTFAAYSGVSGVQPKVLIRGADNQGDWRRHNVRGADPHREVLGARRRISGTRRQRVLLHERCETNWTSDSEIPTVRRWRRFGCGALRPQR